MPVSRRSRLPSASHRLARAAQEIRHRKARGYGLIAPTGVEATIRYAAELGYKVTLLKDATADYSNREMQAAVLTAGLLASMMAVRFIQKLLYGIRAVDRGPS